MANRPIFLPTRAGTPLVIIRNVDFEWHPGMSMAQRRRSVRSLHSVYLATDPDAHILEVSRASETDLGEALSAFNLSIPIPGKGSPRPVECVFQAAKVFDRGGPYTDLIDARPIEAKMDPRLKESGHVISFSHLGERWPTVPLTAFYDWIYLSALHRQPALAQKLSTYTAFTDIVFNPQKSINCQAAAVALYLSLVNRGLAEQALASRDAFLGIESAAYQVEEAQQRLF